MSDHGYGLPTTGFPPPRGPIPDDACPACKHSLTRVDTRGHCTQAVCGCIEHPLRRTDPPGKTPEWLDLDESDYGVAPWRFEDAGPVW